MSQNLQILNILNQLYPITPPDLSSGLPAPGNAELLYFKQLQNEEDRIMDLRIKNFMKQKQAREAKSKADAEAVKAAKQKGIDHIAKAQKV